MNLENTIMSLQEKVSEECFNDILDITEELFIHERRQNAINYISKTLTGKLLNSMP